MNNRIFLFAVCLVGFSISASAHNAWVVKDSTGFHILFGHETTEGYPPAKVTEVTAIDTKGKKLMVKTVASDSSMAIKPIGKSSCFLIRFDNGFFTKTTEGTKNVSKKGIKEYLSSVNAVKYSKSIFFWNEDFLKPLGQKIEVVPAANPLLLKENDSLTIKVFFEGKPLSGAPVNVSGTSETAATTDMQGLAKVKLTSSAGRTGHSLIAASLKIPLKDDPDSDTQSLSGALYFDLKK
jgi:nickel transport protein